MKQLTKLDKVLNEPKSYLTSTVYEDFKEVEENLWNSKNLRDDIKEYIGTSIDYSAWAKELGKREDELNVDIIIENDSSSNNDYLYVNVEGQNVGFLEIDATYDEDAEEIQVTFEYSEE